MSSSNISFSFIFDQLTSSSSAKIKRSKQDDDTYDVCAKSFSKTETGLTSFNQLTHIQLFIHIPAYAVERKGNVKNGCQPESKGKGILSKRS